MARNTTHPGLPAEGVMVEQADYSYQAYQILYWGFISAPILAGVDKFFGFLTNWDMYLAPAVANLAGQAGLSGHAFMQAVGVIEIIAGALVAMKPRLGAYIVALWLVGIIVNLLILPGFYDIALRDFGLCLGALALGRLSHKFGR